jgi:hypothetical protein
MNLTSVYILRRGFNAFTHKKRPVDEELIAG